MMREDPSTKRDVAENNWGLNMQPDYDFLKLFNDDEDTLSLGLGVTLFHKGDPAHSIMYVVRSGAVQICNGNMVLETVQPGGLVGEMAIVDGAPRSASARAEVASEVIIVDERRFYTMVAKSPAFAIRIMQVLTRRLRQTNARV